MTGVFRLSQSLRQSLGQTTPKPNPTGGFFSPFMAGFDVAFVPIGCIILILLAADSADAKVKENTVNKNYATSLSHSPPSSLPRKLICSILRWLSSRRKCR